MMKAFRKYLSALLLLFMLMSLFGCRTDPQVSTQVPQSTAGTTQGSTQGSTETDIGENLDPAILAELKIDLTDSKWIQFSTAPSPAGVFGEGGYFYAQDSAFLTYADLSNGISVTLCSKAGCKHGNALTAPERRECDAHLNYVIFKMFFWDGHIYYVLQDDGPGGIDLYRRNMDGTGEEKVADLGEHYNDRNTGVNITQFIQAGNGLYYRVDVERIVGGVHETIQCDLMRLDLDTHKNEVIAKFTDKYPHLVAAQSDALLYYTVDEEQEMDVMDPDYWEMVDNLKTSLRIWDRPTQKNAVLHEGTYRDFKPVGIRDGEILYSDNNVYCTYNLTTETQTTAKIQSEAVLDDRFALMNARYFCDAKTGEPLDNGIQDFLIYVYNAGEEGVILKRGHVIYVNGDPQFDYTIHSYVTYADLEDGLQEADCLDLWREEASKP